MSMRKLISRSGFWLLAAVLLVGSLSLSRAFAIDGESSTLRFDAPEQFREDLDQYASKLKIGVFQVAVASKNPNYDSYDYVASGAFSSLSSSFSDLSDMNNEKYLSLAQEAAKIVLDNGLVPDQVGSFGDSLSLANGMYLVLPYGNDSLADSVEMGIGPTGGQDKILTTVSTPLYKYTFNPALVALPSREVDGVNNSSNVVDWNSNVTMLLKAEREDRTDGQILINKTVDQLGGSSSPTFIFDIRAEKDGEIVYSNVESLVLNGLTGSISIQNIPVGSTVTVTEVYSGVSYSYVSGNDSLDLNDGDTPLEFDFVNEYKDSNDHSTSVRNHFEKNGSDWKHVPEGGNE